MNLTEVFNKLNKIIETNQKFQTGLYVINTCLHNLKIQVDGWKPTGNNKRNKGGTEKYNNTRRCNNFMYEQPQVDVPSLDST